MYTLLFIIPSMSLSSRHTFTPRIHILKIFYVNLHSYFLLISMRLFYTFELEGSYEKEPAQDSQYYFAKKPLDDEWLDSAIHTCYMLSWSSIRPTSFQLNIERSGAIVIDLRVQLLLICSFAKLAFRTRNHIYETTVSFIYSTNQWLNQSANQSVSLSVCQFSIHSFIFMTPWHEQLRHRRARYCVHLKHFTCRPMAAPFMILKLMRCLRLALVSCIISAYHSFTWPCHLITFPKNFICFLHILFNIVFSHCTGSVYELPPLLHELPIVFASFD